MNIWLLRLSRNWLKVAIAVLTIYVALPFVAPTLMKLGATGAGNAIYFIYGPFCHQFAFRSFFLYGEQIAYPRSNTPTRLTPYEDYIRDEPLFTDVNDLYAFEPRFQLASRAFRGNEQMGYKMTLCERDIAIYFMLLMGAIIFGRVRGWIRPVPLWIYVILGLGPIGLDGFSQLLGYPPFELWPPRETLPIYRVMTGALFGTMNAWLGFPYLELSFQETRETVEAKLRAAGIDPDTV